MPRIDRSRTMRSMWILRSVFIWLLVFGLPLQGLLVATLELRGPAHFHAEDPEEDGARHTHAFDAGHVPQVERHYHLPGDGAILVDDDNDHHHENAAIESGVHKPGAAGAFFALIPSHLLPPLDGLVQAALIDLQELFRSHPPGRLERPPRVLMG